MHGLELPAAAQMPELRRWCQEIVAAAEQLYERQGLAAEIRHACQKYLQDCERLLRQATAPCRSVAVLGLAGAGKTWLARCFVTDPELRSQPVARQEVTSNGRLVWFGPQRPEWLREHDHYRSVAANHMLDLGTPYIVGDTPGWTGSDEGADVLCRTAIASASVKLVVIPPESLRDRRVMQLFEELPGALAVPVIRFRGGRDQDTPHPETRADVEHYWQQWKQAAPNLRLQEPLFVPDADLFAPREPERVVPLVQQRLQSVLRPLLADAQRLQQSVEDEIWQRRELLRQHLAGLLGGLYQRLEHVLQEIQDETAAAVESLAHKVVGSDTYLSKAIQWQLRAWCLEATPPWCFPYRSLLGLLILTSNAWDRLILALFGSTPSMLVSLWQGGKNLKTYWSMARRQQLNFAQQLQEEVRDRLAGPLRRLHAAVAAMSDQPEAEPAAPEQPIPVKIQGLEEFQQRCREILHEEVEREAPRRIPRLLAYLATLVFVFLFAAPIYVIYRQYVTSVWAAFQGETLSWDAFPVPSFPMLLTSFVLSAAPVAAIAMFALVTATPRRRIQLLREAVRRRVDELVRKWQKQSLLRLEIEEPQLKAVKQLWTLKTTSDGPPGR